MRPSRILLITFFLTLLAQPAPADGRRASDGTESVLVMREEALCRTPQCRLGDLLKSGPNPELADRVVERSPEPGGCKKISRNRLYRLLSDWGWRGRLDGPETVLVRSPGVELDPASLRPRVTARLDSLLALSGYERTTELAPWPESLVMTSSHVRWELIFDARQEGRESAVSLLLTDEGGFSRRLPMRVRCRRPARVPVAARDMAAGEDLEIWEFSVRDLLTVDGAPLGVEELSGAVTRGAVEAGQVLTRRNMKPAVLVRAGREVEVRLARGAVTVSLGGIAQSDGALGDLITVRHLDTKLLRRYRVTGPSQVSPSYLESVGEGS